MKVVLFCGGYGLRMRDMRDDGYSGPKPMVPIGDRPLMWHVMRYYAHFGHRDFILCLGYGASAVKDYFLTYDEARSNDFVLQGGGKKVQLLGADIADWRITFVDTGLNATIGERLLSIRPYVEDEAVFLANYADVLTDAPLPEVIERFETSSAVASLLAVQTRSSHHVIQIGDAGHVTSVRPARDIRQWENGGYFVMRPEIFDALDYGEDLVDDGFGRLVRAGRLMAYPYEGFWCPADTLKERAQLEEAFNSGRCPWMLWDIRRSNGQEPESLPLLASPATSAR